MTFKMLQWNHDCVPMTWTKRSRSYQTQRTAPFVHHSTHPVSMEPPPPPYIPAELTSIHKQVTGKTRHWTSVMLHGTRAPSHSMPATSNRCVP